MISSNLQVTLHHVKTHSSDLNNDYIDQQCNNVHTDSNSSVLTISTDNLMNLSYSLRWNNIIVEQSIRKFITQTSINRGFESFYYLNRNKKYRENSIDWKSTFAILDNSPALDTNFSASKRKARRIKTMMEELSTIEQMTNYAPHIYKGWNCVICGNAPENFHHLWICSDNADILKQIRNDSKVFLFEL